MSENNQNLFFCQFCQKYFKSFHGFTRHQTCCLFDPKNRYSIEPVLVSKDLTSIEYLEKAIHIVQYHQRVRFECEDCKKVVILSYLNFKKHPQFLCKTCLQRRTCIERYGVENVVSLESSKQKRKATCLVKYGVDNPTKNKQIKEKLWSNRSRKKLSLQITQNWRHRSPESRLHHREAIKKARQKLSPEQKRQALEKSKETCRLRYGSDFYSGSEKWRSTLKDRIRNACKRYTYESESFDSSWELALWIYAKDHNEEIERESCCFEYEFENKRHHYFPDFKYKGELLELKGDYLIDQKRTQKKLQVAREHGVRVLFLKDVQPYLDYMFNKEKTRNWYKKYKNK